MKLLITGGHVTPALACIDELQAKHKNLDIVFVGRKYANNQEKIETFEFKEISARNLLFIHLNTGRLTRILTARSIQNILQIPRGFIEAFTILKKEKPDKILSFGGYIAFPIAIAASIMKIPVYTHEQTIYPGLANRIIGHIAHKVFVSFPESTKFFPQDKVIVTGNPIRKEVQEVRKKPFTLEKTKPVIYISGGSLGAHQINVLTEKLLLKLLEKYIVIHQTGNVEEYQDFSRLSKIRESLPESLSKNYYVKPHFFAQEIGYIYSIADLVIARAGANTFFELIVLQKPALFIPLSISAHQEQQKHANFFKKSQTGEVYEGDNAEELLRIIISMMTKLSTYKENFIKIKQIYATNAAEKIVETITQSKV